MLDRIRALSRKASIALDPRAAIRLVWKAAPRWTLLTLGLAVVLAVLPLAGLWLTKTIVDGVSAAVEGGAGAPGFGSVLLQIGLLALVGLVTAAARSGNEVAVQAQGHLVTDHVVERVHEKSVELDLAYYEDSRFFDTLHRAQQEAPSRPTGILSALLQVARDGLTLVGVLGLLTAVHPVLPVALVVAVLPGFWVRLRLADELDEWQRQRSDTERRTMYLDRLLTHPWHAKDLRLLGLGDLFRERFSRLRERLRNERIVLARKTGMANVVAHLGAALAVFGAFGFIAFRTYEGAITIGSLVMYFGAVKKGQSVTQGIFRSLSRLYEDNRFLGYLEEFLELESALPVAERPDPIPDDLERGLEVEGVSFRYPGDDRPVLDDVDLRVAPGEMVALVGENGSGKSTLVKLLCRLYDPDHGRVLLEGTDLRQFDPGELRRRMSVVFQDHTEYQMPAWENVWFGDVTRDPDDDRLRRAARATGADEVIRRLPRGYETVLGYWFGDAHELSTGEWQKVALARALLRDADLLVLDEPTSALDARSEARFFRALRDLRENTAILVISHRIAPLADTDRIYVLDRGRIREQGTHAQLLRAGGRYAELHALQRGSATSAPSDVPLGASSAAPGPGTGSGTGGRP